MLYAEGSLLDHYTTVALQTVGHILHKDLEFYESY